jgi:hypothetical protein
VSADAGEVAGASGSPKQQKTLIVGALTSLIVVAWAATEFIRST